MPLPRWVDNRAPAAIAPEIRSLLTIRLGAKGFQVLEAADGIQTMDMVQEHFPDLVILDVMMPRIDGYEVTERLREHDEGKKLPVLLLTAKGRYDIIRDRSRYFLYGLYGFLPKPFFGRELVHKVAEILELMKSREASQVESSDPEESSSVDSEETEQQAAASKPGDPI